MVDSGLKYDHFWDQCVRFLGLYTLEKRIGSPSWSCPVQVGEVEKLGGMDTVIRDIFNHVYIVFRIHFPNEELGV